MVWYAERDCNAIQPELTRYSEKNVGKSPIVDGPLVHVSISLFF